MNMKSNFNLFNFFIGTIVFFYSSCFYSSTELTNNLQFSKIVARPTRQISSSERNSSNCTNRTEFACVSRGCIKKSDLCNGIKDCKDGSDETIVACKNFKCPNESFFRCDYGACVRSALKCNGRVDCADKSDETNTECTLKQSSTSSVVLRRCRPNDQWRCKTSKECILKIVKCNGRNDCRDGSDEDIQDCKGKPSSATTTVKPKPTPAIIERPTNDTCNIPHNPETNSVVLTDREDNWLNISVTGLKAPKFSKVEIFCNPNHALANGEKVQKSVCQQKGQWFPVLRPCQKTCPSLRKDNIDITCYRDGLKVDCNGEMVRGTGVRPVCKPLYHSETEIQGELTCLETGNWDRDLPKCVPDCGIPNIPSRESLVYQGAPTNASDSPWHVAIYKLSRETNNILICGGTLISANMVLSAAHCFFDEGRNVYLNSSSDYEVFVGKYTRDYKTIDNSYQRAHKIRNIIFTDQGYNPVSTGQHSNDIVVLLLKIPVEISTYVLPACVDWSAGDFRPPEQTPGKLVGWGENQVEGVGSQKLLYAELPFISYQQCIGKVKELDPDKFCAGTETGAGARKGDSGGGLVFRRDANTKAKYYLRGIVSTRDAKSRNSYATFTDISKHIEWLEKVRVKVTTEISENQRTSVGVCDVQYGPEKRIEIFDKNNKWLSVSPGSKAPAFSSIEISCNPTYLLPSMETFQRSVCFQEGKWTPPLEPCLKECEYLDPPENIALSCYREGTEVDCVNATLLAGTAVRPRCKNLYRMQGKATYREIKCQENGEWDNELFECVPSCGVAQTELVWPSTLKTDWIPSNASDSPWNVAIYRREKNSTYTLHCSGTLISAGLVMSGSRCFTNTTTEKYFHRTEDYEIVVGKYTSDYNIIDNDFQKKYSIRRFIPPYSDTRLTSGSTANYNFFLLELKTPVEFNKFVLPACIDWESGMSGFQPREGTPGKLVSWALNTSSGEREPSVLRHIELLFTKSCHHSKLAYDDLCTKTINGSVTTWSWYHGAGLVFRDWNAERYFLRGITTGPKIQTYTDISNDLAWVRSAYDRVEKEQAKVSSTSSGSSDSTGICNLPVSPNSKIFITDDGGNKLTIRSPAWRAPQFSKVQVTCNPKYALYTGEKIQRSVCVQENTWYPPLGGCAKTCPLLKSANVELTCYRQGVEVDCDDDQPVLTVVRPRCKNLFKIRGEVQYSEIDCLGDGEWDQELFECEPDCGIPNSEVVKLPTTISGWIPGSDSPWRVAVFKRQKDGKMLVFCGGTLISENMVVSAASCFRNTTSRKIFNSTSEYEVYVSKFTTDYDAIDNDFQRKYIIREFIFGEVNSTSMANIVVLVLKTRVDINNFVIPACIDWNSDTTALRLAKSNSNVNSHGVGIDVSLQVKLTFCSAKGSCAASSPTSTVTWAGYHGGGLLFRDATSGRFYLHGIATRLDVDTFADISNHINWLKKVRDRADKL